MANMNLCFKSVKIVDNTTTGSLARKQRKQASKSLRAVAKSMGVSVAFLSDLELGRRNWTEDNLSRFTGALK